MIPLPFPRVLSPVEYYLFGQAFRAIVDTGKSLLTYGPLLLPTLPDPKNGPTSTHSGRRVFQHNRRIRQHLRDGRLEKKRGFPFNHQHKKKMMKSQSTTGRCLGGELDSDLFGGINRQSTHAAREKILQTTHLLYYKEGREQPTSVIYVLFAVLKQRGRNTNK